MSLIDFGAPDAFETPEQKQEREARKFRFMGGALLTNVIERDNQQLTADQADLQQREADRFRTEATAMLQRNDDAELFRQNASELIQSRFLDPLEKRQQEADRFREEASKLIEAAAPGPRPVPPEEQFNPSASASGMFTDRFADLPPVAGPTPLPPEFVSPEQQAAMEAAPPEGIGTYTRSILPESVLNRISDIPIIGPPAADVIGGVTSPIGMFTLPMTLGGGSLAQGAARLGYGLAGSVLGGAAGQAATELGAPDIPTPLGAVPLRVPFEVAGGLYGGPGRQSIARGLEEQGGVSGLGKRFLTEEVGGSRFSSPRDQAINELRPILERQPEEWAATMAARSEEWSKRVAEAERLKAQYIAEGLHPSEAIRKSESAFKGKTPIVAGAGFDLTPPTEAWLWDQILTLDRFKQDNLAKMFERLQNPGEVMRPFERRYLAQAAGEDLADMMEKVSVNRARVFKGDIPDMSKPPEGVSFKEPLPPEYGGEQLPIRRGESLQGPLPSYDPQRTLDLRLGLKGEPAGVGPDFPSYPSQPLLGFGQRPLIPEGPPQLTGGLPPYDPQQTLNLRLALAGGPQGVSFGSPEVPSAQALSQMDQPSLFPVMESQLKGPLNYDPQRTLDLRLGLKGEPQGVSFGASVPTSEGAKTPTLPDINAPAGKAENILPKAQPRIFDIIADSLGIPRAVMSSGDLSFLRQTGKTMGRHPMLTKEALTEATKAARSEQSALDWTRQLEADPTVISVRTESGAIRDIPMGQLAKEKLHMAVPGTPGYNETGIMSRPEFFISRTAQNMPVIRQSGRAYAIGVNTTTQGVARYWLTKFMKMNGGAISENQLEATLNLSKRLTGQGELGNNRLTQMFKVLGFAPGYRASGPEAFANLLGNPLNTESRQIQRMAAEELFTWASAGSALLKAVALGTGASVVMDIGSPHFGRIQFPGSNTMYNIWGTDQVLARTILQIASQRTVNRLGNETVLGTGEKNPKGYLTAARDALWNYFKSGEDPIIALFTEAASGSDYLGNPLKWDAATAKKLIWERMPMAAQDIADVATTDGPIQALVTAPYAILGGGVSSYTTPEEKLAAAYDQKVKAGTFGQGAVPYTQENSTIRSANIANDPDLSKLNAARDTDTQKINLKTEEPLSPTAGAVNSNLPQAGTAYREQRSDVLTERTARKDQLFEGKNFPTREADKLSDAYFALKPSDRNGNGFIDGEDFKAFYAERDALLAQMPERLRAALTDPAKRFSNPDTVKAERRYQTALDDYKTYLEMPKYQGLTVEQGDKVDAAMDALQYMIIQAMKDKTYNFNGEVNRLFAGMTKQEQGVFAALYHGYDQYAQDPKRYAWAQKHPDMIYFGLVRQSSLNRMQRTQLPSDILRSNLSQQAQQFAGVR